MRRAYYSAMRKALLLLGLLAVAGSAQGAAPGLPPPVFSAKGYLAALAASGPTTALATAERNRCVVRFLHLGTKAKTGLLRPPDPCDPETEEVIDALWLGRDVMQTPLRATLKPVFAHQPPRLLVVTG